jgi:anti-sigma28 factor (negative regulator of flagellin synthesis)
MRIYDVNLTGPSAAESGRAHEAQRPEGAGTARAGRTGAQGTGDRVELSSTLGRLSQAMSSYGSARDSRIQALAAQYQSGNYRPDSTATSKGMVAEALAVGGK